MAAPPTFTVQVDSPANPHATPLDFCLVEGDESYFMHQQLLEVVDQIMSLDHGRLKERFEKAADGHVIDWKEHDWASAAGCNRLVGILNEIIADFVNEKSDDWREHTTCVHFSTADCDDDLTEELLATIYDRAIKNPRKLNSSYTPHSSRMFGEILKQQVRIILRELRKIRPIRKIRDLGCGVGNLLADFAIRSGATDIFGVEINHVPAKMAIVMKEETEKVLNWYGKKFQPYEVEEGSFADSDEEKKRKSKMSKEERAATMKKQEQIRKRILEGDVLIINNQGFQPDLNLALKNEIILELEDGTIIITAQPLGETVPEMKEKEEGAEKPPVEIEIKAQNEGRKKKVTVKKITNETESKEEKKKKKKPFCLPRGVRNISLDLILDGVEIEKADDPVSYSAGTKAHFYLYIVNKRKEMELVFAHLARLEEERQKKKEARLLNAKRKAMREERAKLSAAQAANKANDVSTSDASESEKVDNTSSAGEDSIREDENGENQENFSKISKLAENEKEEVESKKKRRILMESRVGNIAEKRDEPKEDKEDDQEISFEDGVFPVEEYIARKIVKGVWFVKVKWIGFAKTTWEPSYNCRGVKLEELRIVQEDQENTVALKRKLADDETEEYNETKKKKKRILMEFQDGNTEEDKEEHKEENDEDEKIELEEGFYPVEGYRAKKWANGEWKVKVKWVDYEYTTWEPVQNCPGVKLEALPTVR